ncbi:MAG TPA: hypothetical protein VGK73_36530 [Polyangiaceae bacterium]
MRFPRASWSLLLALGLWPGACSPAPAEVPGGEDPASAGRGGSGVTAGTSSSMAGTSSSAGGTSSTTGGTGSSGTTSGGGTPSGGRPGGIGGSAVMGGTTAVLCGQAKGDASHLFLDDLEDGDNTLGNGQADPEPSVRLGYWFTYNEKTNSTSSPCNQAPPPDPQGLLPFPPTVNPGNGSMIGAHTSGTGCTAVWGAGIGVDFNNCNQMSNAYDASAYRGIQFWYKSTTPIRALVTSTPNTAAGGCTGECDNHHGKNFAASPAGTSATITWAELSGTMQIGSPPADPQTFGTKRPFDPTKLLAFQVQVDQQGGASFDLWLDDLNFM